MPRPILNSKRPLKKTAEQAATFLGTPRHRLLFFDEGRFGLKPTLGKVWCKRGSRTPRVSIRPGYKNFYLYSAGDPLAGEHFTLVLPWVDTEMMNRYLHELSAAYPDDTLWVILDRAGWHVSVGLNVPANIRLILLPPYSPELNPVERLWRWLRRHVCRNQLFDSLDALEDALTEMIANLPAPFLASLCHCNYLNINK